MSPCAEIPRAVITHSALFGQGRATVSRLDDGTFESMVASEDGVDRESHQTEDAAIASLLRGGIVVHRVASAEEAIKFALERASR